MPAADPPPSARPSAQPLDPMTVRIMKRGFVLLIVMTVAVLSGPLAIGLVLRGGESPNWPPDRMVEWATFIGVSGGVFALLILCVALALANQRLLKEKKNQKAGDGDLTPPPGSADPQS